MQKHHYPPQRIIANPQALSHRDYLDSLLVQYPFLIAYPFLQTKGWRLGQGAAGGEATESLSGAIA